VTGSGDTTFGANSATKNEIHGFQILEPGGKTLAGNMASGNGAVGFAVEVGAESNTLHANIARANGEDGFRILSSGEHLQEKRRHGKWQYGVQGGSRFKHVLEQ
jgi:parallel beta-helix repeat protein